MKNFTIGERLRYAFDNTMSKGTIALIGWLAVLSVVVIAFISAIVWAVGIAPEGKGDFAKLLWMSLMRTLDAGTMGGDEGDWAFLFAMLGVTIAGIFIISTLIGVLTTGIEARLGALRKGRSKVVEQNHTVILGWSEAVFTIVSELTVANENQKNPCVAILADKDKVEMEDTIRDKVGDTKNTRVVCRTGSPIDLNDLDIIGIHSSKSIVVLAPDVADPDPEVVKVVLAITNHPFRRQEPYHIVAELHDPRNVEVAKMVGKDEVEVVLVSDLVARVIAQTCRQSGLSVVYQELLDFGGDEIYFFDDPALVGKKFGDTLNLFPESTVMGWHPHDGAPALNPPMDTVLRAGDRLVVIAEDDDTTKIGAAAPRVDTAAFSDAPVPPPAPEKTIILGWNWRAPILINQLDAYVAPGSLVTVVSTNPDATAQFKKLCTDLKNLKAEIREGDPADRRLLDSLNIPGYHHVILLSNSDTMTPEAADAHTLFTLLHLRDIADKFGKSFSIVSEMLDVKNRELAEVTRVDDFIVSDRLVSLMLTQVSENKHLNAVFADVFDPEGSEIYLKPVERYVKTGVPVNFATVVESGRQKSELAIGWSIKVHAHDASKAYGVRTNPKKDETVTFAQGDKVIAVAES
ncbi:MAG: potassium transporter TrkA [Deltaproteobacteria bacterium]|nr:potassium transporter TrkA [Deltaproteobacteria bacterium]